MPGTERGRYACPVCPRRFTDLAVKKRHVRTKHPKPVHAEPKRGDQR